MYKNFLKKKFFSFSKLFLISSLVLLNLNFIKQPLIAFADEATPEQPTQQSKTPTDTSQKSNDPNYRSFNVKKYLTIQTGQVDENITGKQEQTYFESSNPIASLILQIINFIALSAASLSFLAVVVGGFMLMSSAGNENQVNSGKEILSKAIIGLVLTLSSYFIISFVQNIFFETAPS